jgi:hypothetical protein
MAAPIVTPAGPLARHGKDVQHFTSDQDVTWTKSGGTFANTAARSIDWTAPNISSTYTVTATNGSAQSTIVTISVSFIVPYPPDYDIDAEDDKKVLVFEPDAGDPQTRTKGPKDIYNFVRNTAPKAEYDEVRQWWKANYPGRNGYFTEPFDTGERRVQIWSAFKRRGQRRNLWGYSFVLRFLD